MRGDVRSRLGHLDGDFFHTGLCDGCLLYHRRLQRCVYNANNNNNKNNHAVLFAAVSHSCASWWPADGSVDVHDWGGVRYHTGC